MPKRLAFACVLAFLPGILRAEVTAIRAGRLIDPETGRAATRQVILVEGENITAEGMASLKRPSPVKGPVVRCLS